MSINKIKNSRKNKIFKKIFAMTSLLVIILLLMQFGFQYFYLEKFYIYNKKQSLETQLTNLKTDIESNNIKEDQIEKILNDYSIRNEVFIGITNVYGISKYGLSDYSGSSYLQLRTNEGKVYTIYIDSFLNDDLFLKHLDESQNIEIEGIIVDEKTNKIYPDVIKIDEDEYYPDDEYYLASDASISLMSEIERDNFNIDDDFYITLYANELSDAIKIKVPKEANIKGSLIDYMILDYDNYGVEYRKNQLRQEIYMFLDDNDDITNFLKENKTNLYTKLDEFTGINNIIMAKPLFIENKELLIMFAITSLQPIEETTNIMQTYFFATLIIAIILAVIISYIYSKKFTRPLVHLDMVTKNMTNLDFSKECDINTNDEIEDLADNINNLSKRLKITLDELKGSNDKLKDEIKYKEEVEEFRKRFIADASHELKTPLTVMKGICEGVKDGVYDINDESNFKSMLNEINDMNKLVYDLLEISKLESGQLKPKEEIFQLCDVVLKINQKLKPLVKSKDIKINLDLDEDFVIADEQQIQRVINNVYSNAIKYTNNNGKIDISIKRIEERCEFEIINSPANITEDDLKKIWQPFYIVEKSRNKALGGFGLGLHMVKEILDKHSSSFGMENKDDGVRFYFELPIIEE
ncbi:HAMP domain-containing sensor histidine kinase [Peptostreptococcaceae bacterium AGR-M142]